MSTEDTVPQKPSFGRRLLLAFKQIFLFIFRVLLTLVVLGAIGAAIYFGAPVLIDEYLLKDVKINTRQIQEISTNLEINTSISEQRLADLQNRLENLEIQGDTDKQTLADIEAQLIQTEAKLQEQAELIQNFDEVRSSIDELGAILTSLDERLIEYETRLEDLEYGLSTLTPVILSNQEGLETLSARFEAREPAEIIRQDLALLKVMEIITRVQVSIGDDNLGLAKDDLETAQELLANLSLDIPANQIEYLDSIASRL